MSTVITDILGSDSFSGSRIMLNANFQAFKNGLDTLGSVYNMDVSFASTGNIDVSAAAVGQIKAKIGSFNTFSMVPPLPAPQVPTITLNGTSGTIVGGAASLSSVLSPVMSCISGGVTGILTVDNITTTAGGVNIFSGLVKNLGGVAISKIDAGAVITYPVVNGDRVIIFDASIGTLTLTTTGLVDGHTITLISKNVTGGDRISPSNLKGSFTSAIFIGTAYKSSITLMYSLSDGKWIVLSSSNMTIA